MFSNRPVRGRRVSTSDLEYEDLEYELARLPRDVTTAITWYMKDNGVTKTELAARMRVTPGRVSQILSGDENLTLRTLAAVCAALDAHLQTELVPNDAPAATPAEARDPGVTVYPSPRPYRWPAEAVPSPLPPSPAPAPPVVWHTAARRDVPESLPHSYGR